MKKAVLIVVVLALLAVGGWYGWQRLHPAQQQASVFYGHIDVRQVSLAFEGSGRVAQVDAEEGDRVQPGQVLAILDTRTLALQADQAAAQLRAQEENLRRLKNGARPAEIAQARSRLAAAQADAQRARREQARLERIATASAGAVSVQDVDRARSAARVAQAAVKERRHVPSWRGCVSSWNRAICGRRWRPWCVRACWSRATWRRRSARFWRWR